MSGEPLDVSSVAALRTVIAGRVPDAVLERLDGVLHALEAGQAPQDEDAREARELLRRYHRELVELGGADDGEA